MRENNRYHTCMLDRRKPSARSLPPRHRRDDGPRRPLDRPFETVDGDFDEISLDDLRRQAGAGRIDVADL